MYGISQNPTTKNCIVVFENNCYLRNYCANCGKKYTNTQFRWCKPCQINYLKENFTSRDEKIDNLIQEMQLKINDCKDIIFEWIPYNQFNEFKEIGKGGFFGTVYLAKWKDGPLRWSFKKYEYIRNSTDKIVDLVYLNNLDITNESLNEV